MKVAHIFLIDEKWNKKLRSKLWPAFSNVILLLSLIKKSDTF